MKLTAKKLSELTQVPAANIRKWRERYGILAPQRGDNGYLYYTADDYRVLLSISQQLKQGQKLSNVMKLGRDQLLVKAPEWKYSAEEMSFLEQVIQNDLAGLAAEFDACLELHSVEYLVRKKIWPAAVLIGQAWQSGFITVATEHAFSRWIMGYLSQIAMRYQRKNSPTRIFVSFPGDEHELGAMMHYAIMSSQGMGGRFCGALALDRLMEELNNGDYEEVHVSATLDRTRAQIDSLVHHIHAKYPHIKVKIGGAGATSKDRQAS